VKKIIEKRIESFIKEKFDFDIKVKLEKTDEKFGDYATNLGFILAKKLRKSPQEIEKVFKKEFLKEVSDFVEEIKVIKGFINFRLKDKVLIENLKYIIQKGAKYGEISEFKERVNLEYISANPTGPLNVANARAGIFGDTLYEVMKKAGYDVVREYYVNDATTQVKLLVDSFLLRCLEIFGYKVKLPEQGYHGKYLKEISIKFLENQTWKVKKHLNYIKSSLLGDEARFHFEKFKEFLLFKLTDYILKKIQFNTLKKAGLKFDVIVKESFIRKSKYVNSLMDKVKDFVYIKDGALFLKTKEFGDVRDRVLVRSNGEPTYLFFDLAYHLYKIYRGFDILIDIWGPDHAGHIPSVKAGLSIMGYPDKLEVIIVQQVNLLRDGKPVKMSKRKGEFYDMERLIEEVGLDAVRFFFLLRSADAPLNFDLSLAKKLSSENPVYYVQYLYARVHNLLLHGEDKGILPDEEGIRFLNLPEERSLMLRLLYFPDLVENMALKREVHHLTHYLLDLANIFHSYYQKYRIVDEGNRVLSSGRLYLVKALKQVVANCFDIIKIRKLERM